MREVGYGSLENRKCEGASAFLDTLFFIKVQVYVNSLSRCSSRLIVKHSCDSLSVVMLLSVGKQCASY